MELPADFLSLGRGSLSWYQSRFSFSGKKVLREKFELFISHKLCASYA